jgi:DNA polymerase-3 subunit delta
VYLVKGTDPLLRDRVVDEVVTELLAGDDRSLALEDFTVPGRAGGEDAPAASGAEAREAVVAAVLNAASSPPFMTSHRVVVIRDSGALTASDVEPIVAFLADPLDTTLLVFVQGGGTMPTALSKQLKATKAIERAPESEKTQDVLGTALRRAGLRLRPEAAKVVTSHLGDDAGRVDALVAVLAEAHPEGAQLGEDDVAPYLGDAGAVPAYQLTNAIEAGDAARALEVLHRLMTVSSPQQPKPMHPLQIMGTLTSSYRRVLRCDDPSIRTADDAIAALGGRVSSFPARKAMEQAHALGSDGIRTAFDHLAQADLDLKGARGIPEDAVMEVLVVRLARLAASAGGGRRGRGGGR